MKTAIKNFKKDIRYNKNLQSVESEAFLEDQRTKRVLKIKKSDKSFSQKINGESPLRLLDEQNEVVSDTEDWTSNDYIEVSFHVLWVHLYTAYLVILFVVS